MPHIEPTQKTRDLDNYSTIIPKRKCFASIYSIAHRIIFHIYLLIKHFSSFWMTRTVTLHENHGQADANSCRIEGPEHLLAGNASDVTIMDIDVTWYLFPISDNYCTCLTLQVSQIRLLENDLSTYRSSDLLSHAENPKLDHIFNLALHKANYAFSLEYMTQDSCWLIHFEIK